MVLILLADGFEEVEALTPCDYLRRAGADVLMVSMNASRTVTGAHDMAVLCDVTADDILPELPSEKLEMLLLPGGKTGVDNLDSDSRTDLFLAEAKKTGAFVCAICAGPSLLGKRGWLRGKKAVCYPGFESCLLDAEVLEEPVVRDGKMITAKAAGAAQEFSFSLIEALRGREAALQVKNAVYFEK